MILKRSDSTKAHWGIWVDDELTLTEGWLKLDGSEDGHTWLTAPGEKWTGTRTEATILAAELSARKEEGFKFTPTICS